MSGPASPAASASSSMMATSSSPPGTPSMSSSSISSRARMYRTTGESKWVTREIAALDFLLGIPMEKESSIVQAGYMQQQLSEKRERVQEDELGQEEKQQEEENKQDELEPPTPTTSIKWWDKLINKGEVSRNKRDDFVDLEQPDEQQQQQPSTPENNNNEKNNNTAVTTAVPQPHSAPGRRLDGRDDAIHVQIPLSHTVKTRHRSIARQAAIREWELRVAHGLDGPMQPALLDGRVYFSSKGSYPMGVYSVLKYEPKKEEAARRRQKLEARGGGGTQFIVPERDWRGTSYRALLPRVEKKNRAFNRHLRRNRQKLREKQEEPKDDPRHDDNDSIDEEESSSSGESDAYVPGFLDDPEMRQGRHRHVMSGDRVTGCIISSTIQFVKPADLKADLNKQFRERFDGWEPPKSQRKWIGARVVDGVYTLMDPTEAAESEDRFSENEKPTSIRRRERQSSVSSSTSAENNAKETIRMPPSLTLSKIRSIKQQALLAVVKADLEISTVALACVYFERLCLDCRVDKTNRRLSFAACLLLAAKINESNVALVMQKKDGGGGEDVTDKKTGARLQSLIRPTKRSSTMFASLLEFFAHDWSISVKNLFTAEWGVFAALGFSLHATPSQVAFHFKRFMKVLGWGQLAYLGPDQYNQWQDCLLDEKVQREIHEKRRERRRERQERKLLKLQRKLHRQQEQESKRTANTNRSDEVKRTGRDANGDPTIPHEVGLVASPSKHERSKKGAMKLLNRFSLKRQHPSMPAMDKLVDRTAAITSSPGHESKSIRSRMVRSPSMPLVSTGESETLAMDTAEGSAELMSDGGGINV